MADRFNSSNREVAALVNASLKDLNLLTTDNTIIHSKVFRGGNEQEILPENFLPRLTIVFLA